jgi:hypothetical protein
MTDLFRSLAVGAALLTIPAAGHAADERARELLQQVRSAIGGPTLEGLRSLTVGGEFQRVVGDENMAGRWTSEWPLPDRIRRDEQLETPMGDGPTLVTVVNGDAVWRDVENSGTSGHVMVIRRQAPEAGTDDGRPVRAEFQRLLIGLLADTSLLGLEATYAGQAESPDGTADAIDLTGPGGFEARLFVGRETRLPLMLTYRAVPPQARMRVMRRGPGAPPRPPDAVVTAPGGAPVVGEPGHARPEAVPMQMFFADHRRTGGLMLPTRITIQIDGRPSEEWQLTDAKPNASISPSRFQKR